LHCGSITKLGWIKRQQAKFAAQPRQSQREMVGGESHYFLGQRYRIRIIDAPGPGKIVLRNKSIIEMHVRPDTDTAQRELILSRWYRVQLKQMIPPLLEKWQPLLGVQAAAWGIKRMKTKWGSCNIAERRIWLNLELAKKSPPCLEYILVHELLHLLERHHNDRFAALLERHMPTWRSCRDELNSAMLGHEQWNS
jgi:predicted metal-dependent hydrolase